MPDLSDQLRAILDPHAQTNWESLYLQLGQLASEMPQLRGAITPEINRWLGRAAHLVKAVDQGADAAIFDLSCNNLTMPSIRDMSAQTIECTVFRALATAEAKAPAAARGGFVGVGAELDALQVIGKVLAEASRDVLIVDAYMDSKAFTDFAPTAAATVSVRLLSDSSSTKQEALRPGLTRWRQQFPARPIEVRLARPRALHDRLIVVDGKLVWTLTQSLKDFAKRSPALVQRVDVEMATLKVDFYEQLWTNASPVT